MIKLGASQARQVASMDSFPTTGKAQCCKGQLVVEKFKPICSPCNGPLNMVLVAILYNWAGGGFGKDLVENHVFSIFAFLCISAFSCHRMSTCYFQWAQVPPKKLKADVVPKTDRLVTKRLTVNSFGTIRPWLKRKPRLTLTLLRTGSSCDAALCEVVSQQRPGQMWLT